MIEICNCVENHIPIMRRKLVNFSSEGICLVLALQNYDPDDYIRGHHHLVEMKLSNPSFTVW